MSVQVKVLINQEDITIANSATVCTVYWESAIINVLSDGTPRTIHEWDTYIRNYTGIGTNLYMYLYDNEMVQVRFSAICDGIKFVNSDIAEALGFVVDTIYEVDTNNDVYGDSWGYFRLVIQGVESTNSNGAVNYSRMIAPERITGKNNNETFESIGYVINSYDKRFDMKRWKITSHWLTTDKEQWVKDFLHNTGNGKNSDNLKLYGDDFWIEDTETWKLLTDAYGGIEVDVGHRKYVKFSLGLREVL